jgi:hypothetical protein
VWETGESGVTRSPLADLGTDVLHAAFEDHALEDRVERLSRLSSS